MNLQALFSVYLVLVVSLVEGSTTKAAEPEKKNDTVPTANTTKTTGNFPLKPMDGSMIQRALYVLIGITIIGMLYFLVRAVRLKKSSTPRKKYGLLTNYDDSVEMAQLESDEEEDTTLYDARSLRR